MIDKLKIKDEPSEGISPEKMAAIAKRVHEMMTNINRVHELYSEIEYLMKPKTDYVKESMGSDYILPNSNKDRRYNNNILNNWRKKIENPPNTTIDPSYNNYSEKKVINQNKYVPPILKSNKYVPPFIHNENVQEKKIYVPPFIHKKKVEEQINNGTTIKYNKYEYSKNRDEHSDFLSIDKISNIVDTSDTDQFPKLMSSTKKTIVIQNKQENSVYIEKIDVTENYNYESWTYEETEKKVSLNNSKTFADHAKVLSQKMNTINKDKKNKGNCQDNSEINNKKNIFFNLDADNDNIDAEYDNWGKEKNSTFYNFNNPIFIEDYDDCDE